MSTPKLSVIIPAYNAETTLQRTIESVLNQSFEDYELIVINDGSKDGTGDVCAHLAQKDLRIQVDAQDNQGVSSARNAGIKTAQGKYIMFVDDDDEIMPEHLKAYVTAIEEGQFDVVIGGITRIYIDQQGKQVASKPDAEPGECSLESFWNKMCVKTELFGHPVNKIFRSDIIKKNNIRFRTDMISQEDMDFCLSYYQFCEKIAFISDSGYLYYYQEEKRQPQIYSYIENQLKLIHAAEKKTELTAEAVKAVRDRIVLWVYSLCYNAGDKKELHESMAKLNRIDGLYACLKDITVSNEKTMIAKWYCQRRYQSIYRHFVCRRYLKKAVSAFRKR